MGAWILKSNYIVEPCRMFKYYLKSTVYLAADSLSYFVTALTNFWAQSGQIWAKKLPDPPVWTKLQKFWVGLAPSGQIWSGAIQTKTWVLGSGLSWECHGSCSLPGPVSCQISSFDEIPLFPEPRSQLGTGFCHFLVVAEGPPSASNSST